MASTSTIYDSPQKKDCDEADVDAAVEPRGVRGVTPSKIVKHGLPVRKAFWQSSPGSQERALEMLDDAVTSSACCGFRGADRHRSWKARKRDFAVSISKARNCEGVSSGSFGPPFCSAGAL